MARIRSPSFSMVQARSFAYDKSHTRGGLMARGQVHLLLLIKASNSRDGTRRRRGHRVHKTARCRYLFFSGALQSMRTRYRKVNLPKGVNHTEYASSSLRDARKLAIVDRGALHLCTCEGFSPLCMSPFLVLDFLISFQSGVWPIISTPECIISGTTDG